MHPRDLPPRLPQNRQKGWSGPVSRVLCPASIYLGLRSPAASSGQPGALTASGQHRPPHGSSPPIWPCSGRGLASRCVSTPLVRSYRTISPLPTSRRAVSFLCHFPSGRPAWVLPSALPCGARTFLTRQSLGDGGRGRSAHSVSIVAHSVTTRATSSCRHWRMPYQGQRHWGPDLALIC